LVAFLARVSILKVSRLFHFSRSRLFAFLLIARMLWDKGVGEFVKAAHLLKQRGIDAEFCLLGFLEVKKPLSYISKTNE
jgi:glycosyltransferase involved in cell wall biosynthesis